jgi:hypothetical protein
MKFDLITASAPQIMRKDLWVPEDLMAQVRQFNPKTEFGKIVQKVLQYIPDAELANELIDRITSIVVMESKLFLDITRVNGRVERYGMVSYKAVTTTGVEFLCKEFQSTNPTAAIAKFNWHAIGTSSGAESTGSTALGGELTSANLNYVARSSGTSTQSAANVYQTVGNTTVDTAQTIYEHGIFNSSVISSGSLWDRSQFAVVSLSSGDSIQTDYRLTITAGG